MPTWNWIDGAIIVILALSVITGLFRGFVKELLAFVVWVLAIWMSYHYYKEVAVLLQSYIHDDMARSAAAFILIILATVVAGSLFNAVLSFIIRSTGLSGTDRLLGMGFGLVRGVFIVSLLMLAAKMTSIVPAQTYTKHSLLYAKFDPIVNWLSGFAPDMIKQMSALEANHSNA